MLSCLPACLSVYLPAYQLDCLTTFTRLKAKQRSTQPPFHAAIANTRLARAFSECLPSSLCLFFYLVLHNHFLLHVRKLCGGINFPYRHFPKSSYIVYLDATKQSIYIVHLDAMKLFEALKLV